MNTFGLAGMLTRARLRARSGTGVLDVLAVVAFLFRRGSRSQRWVAFTCSGTILMR